MLYGVIGQQQTNIRKVYQTVLCINTILNLSGRILPKLGKTILILQANEYQRESKLRIFTPSFITLMIRGYINFRCDNCNNTFRALDIEYNATIFSVPMPCPKCNSRHTYIPSLSIFGFYPFGNDRDIYKKIWEEMDKNKLNEV